MPVEILDIGRVLLGLVVLIAGGEALVRGASAIAARLGIAPLVVGLVVVSAATSAPELSVTIGAVAAGEPSLAVGNVVGSNIANVLLVLGLSALILPLLVKRQLIRFDIPVMVGITVLLFLLVRDGSVSQLDGAILFIASCIHVVLSFRFSKKDPELAAVAQVPTAAPKHSPVVSNLISAGLIVGGIGLLVLGASLLVTGASNIATSFGVSGLVVGLTVVAVGTSLPELATSIIAVRRGERDLAVGNIVGSNIFNIGVVLGLPALVFSGGIPVPEAAIALDIPLALAAAVALIPIAFTGFAVKRWEGALFVALYLAYTAYLVLAAAEHDAVRGFSVVMLAFVLPLLGVALIATTAYEVGYLRAKRATRQPGTTVNRER